ncbi:hypothetical protein Fmac_028940 [Flemingia macrophylla]|uniref:Uncharacterized protein n=1 Tax=Flemingia macrophylla TaxID=520843 RepID=A0ABD1L918_9FABA
MLESIVLVCGDTLLWHRLMGSKVLSVSHEGSPFLHISGRGQKTMREEYHLTPKDGNIQSDVVLLNGNPLQLTKSLDIPEMKPQLAFFSRAEP